MTNRFIRDVKEVIRRLRNRGIELEGNRQYPAIPTIDNSIESHTNALRAIREAIETHERRNSKAALDSFVRLYELEDVLGGFQQGESSVTGGGNYSGQNLGVGAQVYKETDPVPDPRLHKFRSVRGEDGIAVSQDESHVIIGLGPDAFPGSRPAIGDIGATAIGCGTSIVFTPSTQLANLQVDDLMVMVIVASGVKYNEATCTYPSGWKAWRHARYVANGDWSSLNAVYYKFATSADVTGGATHTFTNNASGATICGYVFGYRNAHKQMPLMGNQGMYSRAWYPNTPGISTAQAVMDIFHYWGGPAQADPPWPPGYNPDIGRPPDQYFYKGFQDGNLGINKYTFIGSRIGTIADDENLIPAETPTSSGTGAGWTYVNASIDLSRDSGNSLLRANNGTARHYMEYQIPLVGGRKYTFAVNHHQVSWNYVDGSESLGLSFVDPSDNERGWIFRTLNYPGTSEAAALDPLADRGTVWQVYAYDSTSSGVPSRAGARFVILFTAPSTGTYKLRVSHTNSDWQACYWTHGDNSALKRINSILFREGWFTPHATYTPNGAVTTDSAAGRLHTWGWKDYANVGGWRTTLSVTPAWDELPNAFLLVGAGHNYPSNAYVDYDGLTTPQAYVNGNDPSGGVAPSYSVYPELYGTRRAYYFEVKALASGGAPGLGIFANGAGVSAARAYWDFWGNTIYWHDGTQSSPTGGSGVGLNDIFGCSIDFRDPTSITIKFWRNGTEVASKTVACSTNGWLDSSECWTALIRPRATHLNIGSLLKAAFTDTQLAYLPVGGYLPYDALGVVPAPSVENITSVGTGVSLLGGAAATPTIKSLIEGTAIDLTSTDTEVTISVDPTELPDGSITLAKVQDISTEKLLGRTTAGTGDVEEIGIGVGLQFSGGNLISTGVSPTTTKGDLIVRGVSADERLPAGGGAAVLTMVGGMPTWVKPHNTVLLMHCNGTDGSTSLIDEVGKTVTAVGNAQIDTAQSKFGGASLLLDGAGDYATVPGGDDFNFGTGDFTVEFFHRKASNGSYRRLISYGLFNTAGNFQIENTNEYIYVHLNASYINIGGACLPNLNQWYHIAVTRQAGVVRLFVDGVQQGSNWSNSGSVSASGTFTIGASPNGNEPSHGWFDEIRVLKGVAMYTANFTPPDAPLDFDYDYLLPTTTAGDLVVRGATNDIRLPVGENSQVLTVVNGMPAWADPPAGGAGGGAGALSFVTKATVTGSAATSITVPGLDLDADGEYLVELALSNATSSLLTLRLTYNSDTTLTNYWWQATGANGSSVYAGRANDPHIGEVMAVTGSPYTCIGKLRRNAAGRVNFYADVAQSDTSSARNFLINHSWTTTNTNVTSLTITSTVASSLAVGSTVRIWKLTEASGGVAGTSVTHPDAPPATPEAEDDEFEGEVLDSKWVWDNQSSATAVVRDGALVMKAAVTASVSVNSLLQDIPDPSGDWKYRTKFNWTIFGNSPLTGIVLKESSTGKIVTFIQVYNSGLYHQVAYFTNSTTYASTPLSIGVDPLQFGGLPGDIYYEVEKSGSTLYFRWSRDGVTWYNWNNLSLTGHFTTAPDKVGVGCAAQNASLVGDCTFHWFRRIGANYKPGKFTVNGAAAGGAQTDPMLYTTVLETHFLLGTTPAGSAFTQNGSIVSDTTVFEADHPGVLRVASNENTGASGSAVWSQNTNSIFNAPSTAGSCATAVAPGALVFEAIVRWNQVPAGVQHWRVGFLDFSGATGAFSAYLEGGSGVVKVRNELANGTSQETTVVNPPAANTWVHLRIEVNTTAVSYYIDKALVATHSTAGLPLSTDRVRPSVYASNQLVSITPAVILDVDWMRVTYEVL